MLPFYNDLENLGTGTRQRAALAEAQEGLDIVMAQLKDAKARLAGVQNRLAELQKGFDDAVAKKQVSQVTSHPKTEGQKMKQIYGHAKTGMKAHHSFGCSP